jgi:hypothetical protein
MVDELVVAHLAHVHDAALGPAEASAVETERGRGSGVPSWCQAQCPSAVGVERPARLVAGAAHDVERHALRVGDQRHAADLGQVHRRHVDGPARRHDVGDGRVHIIDADIAEPARRHARGLRWQRHHPGDLAALGREDVVARKPPNSATLHPITSA